MQVVLCDICEQPIRGEAVSTDEGRPRVAQRGGASIRFLCSGCGNWLRDAMEHLRVGLRGA